MCGLQPTEEPGGPGGLLPGAGAGRPARVHPPSGTVNRRGVMERTRVHPPAGTVNRRGVGGGLAFTEGPRVLRGVAERIPEIAPLGVSALCLR